MRDKIVFFIFGAVLATIAYLVGDLQTLTAEDKVTELDTLYVNNLIVKDSIGVGGIGKNFIYIGADDEIAQITLHSSHSPHDDAPRISLIAGNTDAGNTVAVIKAVSHSKRPEATCILGIMNDGKEKKYQSSLVIQDLDGLKGIHTD